MALISYLRDARILSGFTQSQLADITGISRNTIRSIENGSGVTLEHAFKIAKALNYQVESLWSLYDDNSNPCDLCYKPECVGCKLSDPDEYEAYIQRLGADADFRFG